MSDIYYVNNDIIINEEVVIPQDSLISNVNFIVGKTNIILAEFKYKGNYYRFEKSILLSNSFFYHNGRRDEYLYKEVSM